MANSKREVIVKLVKEIKNSNQNLAKLKYTLKETKKSGIDLNTKYYKGRTLMHYAAISGGKGVVTLLDKLGVDARICDDDYNTALHLAVIKNVFCTAKELLKINNVDVDAPGEFEQTPLHKAVIHGNLDMVKLLIKNGADHLLVDEKNQSVIDYANDEKDEKIIGYLNNIDLKRKEVKK